MSKDDFFQKQQPPQLLSVLLKRTQGLYSPGQFQRNIVRLWWENDSCPRKSQNRQPLTSSTGQPRQKIQLLLDGPEIVSPHRSLIPTMSYDRVDGRFVLVGSSDGSVSIYDLSKWGSEKFLRRDNYSHRKSSISTNNDWDDEQAHMFHPVARTLRVPSALRRAEGGGGGGDYNNTLPEGHFSSLTHVQWYPVDPGAFVSASLDGSILLWDTNRMQPVLHATPFEEGDTCSCVHLGGDGPGGSNSASSMLVAAGSWQDPAITLVDLRSGAASHQLQGHDRGISCLSWSPTSSVILASGSKDGSIRLWDIRKSGSRACVTQLHRQEADSGNRSRSSSCFAPYSPDYTHLNKLATQPRRHDITME
jgi:DNA excision repair protein ERCC-8